MKKLISTTLLLLLITITIAAKPKTGTLVVRSNIPLSFEVVGITNATRISHIPNESAAYNLDPGGYTIIFTLPDGTTRERVVIIKRDCTTSLDLSYYPPACPQCPTPKAEEKVIPKETEPKETEPKETVPEVGPSLFDSCCNCKRDDLKARLDLFTIELNRNPRAQGRIISSSTVALEYLLHSRGMDHARVELRLRRSGCTELWILP